MDPSDIAAVIVSYHPDLARLALLAEALSGTGMSVIVVDNSAGAVGALPGLSAVRQISMGGNQGIAVAQNAGIRASLNAGFQAVLFLDQDSIMEPAALKQLIAMLDAPDVDLAAPVHYNRSKNVFYPLVDVDQKGRRQTLWPQHLVQAVELNNVISSGLLVRASVFRRIGLMDEALFIDYVDTEWCLRAAAQGLRISVNPAVCIDHALGDDSIQWAGHTVAVHSPVRRYYRVRNAFLLWRKPWVPKRFLLRDMVHGALDQCVIMRHARGARADYARLYLRAVLHGLKGVDGPLAPSRRSDDASV